MYFWRKTYNTSLELTELKGVFQSAFEIDEKKKSLKMMRERAVPNRGFIRVMIPGLIVKAYSNKGMVTVKMKLDLVATIVLTCFIAASIFTFTLDPVKYPREFPDWAPFALLSWYLFALIIEIRFTLKAIKTSTSAFKTM